MDWLVPFLAHHKRLAVFNRLWSAIGPYPGFPPFRKPYTAVTQWQGKELKMLGRTILSILGASLLEPSAEQRGPFKEAILCVKGLIFFHLIISKTQNQSPETPGSIGCIWESPKPAFNHRSLWETPGVGQSKVISLVDTIFGIRRKIEEDYFLTISCFPDDGKVPQSYRSNYWLYGALL